MAINTSDVTTVSIAGTGIFDVLMQTATLHLEKEFNANRIIGNDYATVYTSILQNAMQSATQYAIQKPLVEAQTANEVARLASTLLQDDLIQSQINQVNKSVEIAEQQRLELVTLLPLKDDLQQSQLNESIAQVNQINKNIEIAEQQRLELVALLPLKDDLQQSQLNQINAQVTLLGKQVDESTANISLISDRILTEKENTRLMTERADTETANTKTKIKVNGVAVPIAGVRGFEIESAEYNSFAARAQTTDTFTQGAKFTGTAGRSFDKADKEIQLLQRKYETELSQTCDNVTCPDLSTGAATGATKWEAVGGVMGKQIQLYTKQAQGYDRNAEVSAARLYTDIAAIQYNTRTDYPSSAVGYAGNGLTDPDIKAVLDKVQAGVASITTP